MRVFESERLILRPPMGEEYDRIYHTLATEIEGEAFTREMFAPEWAFDLALAQQALGQPFGRPAIFLKPELRYIGYTLLMPRLCTAEEVERYTIRPGREKIQASIEAEIGWAISERYQRQGYATEAAGVLAAYCLHELELPRLIAFTDRDNLPSLRVMQKLGMRLSDAPDSDSICGILEQ